MVKINLQPHIAGLVRLRVLAVTAIVGAMMYGAISNALAQADLADQIAEATGNAPIMLALDPVGGDTSGRLADSLGYGGTLVTYGVLSGKPATLNTGKVIFNDTRLRGFWLYKWYQTATMQEKQEAFGQVIPLIVNGTLKANIDSRYSVDEIEQAVTRAWEGGRNGKVLIVPSSLE